MGRLTKETVSASFHYFTQSNSASGSADVGKPIEREAFRNAMVALQQMRALDLTDQDSVDALRFGTTVPVMDVIEIQDDVFFGAYKAVYSGHSYENTAVGIIPHDSASLRKFHFIAYLSDDGRLYLGCQYLGQFGSYTGLKNTIKKAFEPRLVLKSHSIRSDVQSFHHVEAKEIIVEYMKRGNDAGSPNVLTRGPTTVAFKEGPGSSGFAAEARRRIFRFHDSPVKLIRTEVASLLREAGLTTVADDDIIDCTVVASVHGKDKKFYFINENGFASKFIVDVGLTPEGHPVTDQLRNKMLELLNDEILAATPDV